MDFDDTDEEDNLEWNSTDISRTSPKKGRRANINPSIAAIKTDGIADSDEYTSSPFDSSVQGEAPMKPPRRKTGGWADTTTKSAKGKRSTSLSFDDENANSNVVTEKDITTIPDLDDFQEDDLAAQVAKAPHIAINRVATYKELDSDLLKHSAFATLDDIDLKALTKFLSPESELREEDVSWTWDILLADVSSKLMLESDSQEAS